MDQKTHWDRTYSQRNTKQAISSFVNEVKEYLKPNSKVLELGCGEGFDAVEISKHANVIALDLSDKAIELAKERFLENENLKFETYDISQPLEFEDDSFDLVYARLSLHYFDDKTTRKIFSEVQRVLKPGGILAFLVKSTNDPLNGEGEKIGEDMYERNDHIRHFFSKSYTKALLKDKFEIQTLDEIKEKDEFYGRKSVFIKALANSF